jgi:predicted metal-dependent phosphoesterase TrpH
VSKLGIQRSVGLPECATPPQEVYELAKRRGMDFVTITDHDTIDGALELAAEHDDVFVSEELTAWFRGEPQAVHVLVYGITPDDHDWLQAHNGDVEACAAYLAEHEIATALAHPFYAVEAPLTARHRRRLAELFGAWEVRNGARAPELNAPAAVYVETHGGTGVGGSDDHAGVDIGRTWTQTPPAATIDAFLGHIRAAAPRPCGQQGSAAKWAHAAMAIAIRALGAGDAAAKPNPVAVMKMVERTMTEGNARRGDDGSGDLGPDDARALMRAWMDAVDIEMTAGELLASMQADDFEHADLFRRARRKHERKLGKAVDEVVALTEAGHNPMLAALGFFDACLAAIPTRPRRRSWAARRARLVAREDEPLRVALVADGVGANARRHAYGAGDPGARRARLRGRGRGHRPHRRPPAPGGPRGRPALLRRPAGRRASPAGDRRGARRRRYDARTRRLAGAVRRRRRAAFPRDGGPRCSAATTPSSAPTRRCAAATARSGSCHPGGRRVLRRLRSRPAPEPRVRRGAARAGHLRRAHRPLGPRRRPRALRPRPSATRRASAAARPDHVLYAGARPRRRAPTCWPTRSSRARARPAAAPVPGRRRARSRRRCASARRARDVPGLAGGRRARPRYASADVFLFASRTDTFGRCCSRRRPAACRSSRSPRAARARSSRTASPACCASLTRPSWRRGCDCGVAVLRERSPQDARAVGERTWERRSGAWPTAIRARRCATGAGVTHGARPALSAPSAARRGLPPDQVGQLAVGDVHVAEVQAHVGPSSA